MSAEIIPFPESKVRRWPLAGSPDYEWGVSVFELYRQQEKDKLEALLTAIAKHGKNWRKYL